jgi:hypothetical protein
MKKMSSGWVIAISVLLALVAATASIFCWPFGINDQQSSSGFAVMSLFFFIQAIMHSSLIQFGERDEISLGEYLGRGINKLLAVVALSIYAVPHPAFTGVLLWVGISLLFLNSGAKDICHVGYTLWKEVKEYVADWRDAKQRDKAQQAMVTALLAEEAKVKQAALVEEGLMSDLANFLDDSNPNTGQGRK